MNIVLGDTAISGTSGSLSIFMSILKKAILEYDLPLNALAFLNKFERTAYLSDFDNISRRLVKTKFLEKKMEAASAFFYKKVIVADEAKSQELEDRAHSLGLEIEFVQTIDKLLELEGITPDVYKLLKLRKKSKEYIVPLPEDFSENFIPPLVNKNISDINTSISSQKKLCVLSGESGYGKSYLLKKLYIETFGVYDTIPIYYNLEFYKNGVISDIKDIYNIDFNDVFFNTLNDNKYKCFIYLDTFDEIENMEEDKRNRIKDELKDILASKRGIKFILTSKPNSIGHIREITTDFDNFTLNVLEDRRIKDILSVDLDLPIKSAMFVKFYQDCYQSIKINSKPDNYFELLNIFIDSLKNRIEVNGIDLFDGYLPLLAYEGSIFTREKLHLGSNVIEFLVKNGILYKIYDNYAFKHSIIRNHFISKYYHSNILKKLKVLDNNEELISPFLLEKPIYSLELLKSLGDICEESKNSPVLDEAINQFIIPLKNRTLTDLLDHYRNKFDDKSGVVVANILSIMNTSRGELSGVNLSYLNLCKFDFKMVNFSRVNPYIEGAPRTYLACDFSYSKFDPKKLFSNELGFTPIHVSYSKNKPLVLISGEDRTVEYDMRNFENPLNIFDFGKSIYDNHNSIIFALKNKFGYLERPSSYFVENKGIFSGFNYEKDNYSCEDISEVISIDLPIHDLSFENEILTVIIRDKNMERNISFIKKKTLFKGYKWIEIKNRRNLWHLSY